jgi:hypothetical protein
MILNSQTSVRQNLDSVMGVNQLREVIQRLVDTVTNENELLDSHCNFSLETIIQKKGQLLLDLMRAQRHIQPDLIRSQIQNDVLRLRKVMAENQRKLAIHFAAAKDITDTILDVLRHNESDGTYLGWSGHKQVQQ